MSKGPKQFDTIINEGSTAKYTATLENDAGTVLALTDVAALTLTMANVADGAIINGRDEQNVLNANNVSIDATSGLLTFILQPLDTAIQNAALPFETHRATFKCTYNGTSQKNWDVDFLIRNLSGVS